MCKEDAVELQRAIKEITGVREVHEKIEEMDKKLDGVISILQLLLSDIDTKKYSARTVGGPIGLISDMKNVGTKSKSLKEISVCDWSVDDLPEECLKFSDMRVTTVSPNGKKNARGDGYGIRLQLRGVYRAGIIRNQIYAGYYTGPFEQALIITERCADILRQNPLIVAESLTICHRKSSADSSRFTREFLRSVGGM
jgi:hypothetical protein